MNTDIKRVEEVLLMIPLHSIKNLYVDEKETMVIHAKKRDVLLYYQTVNNSFSSEIKQELIKISQFESNLNKI